MLLKKPNTLNYPIVFWNIAKFFQIVFRYLKHLDRLPVSSRSIHIFVLNIFFIFLVPAILLSMISSAKSNQTTTKFYQLKLDGSISLQVSGARQYTKTSQFSQKGWLGRASQLVTLKELVGFENNFHGKYFHHPFYVKSGVKSL